MSAGLGALPGRFRALPRPRRWAAAAGLAWAVLVIGYAVGFIATAGGALGRGMVFLDGMFLLLALVLPLILIRLAAGLAEELERQRAVITALAELTPPLFEALAATRTALERHAPASPLEMQAAIQAALADGAPDPGALTELVAGQADIIAELRAARRASPPAAAPTAKPDAPARRAHGRRDDGERPGEPELPLAHQPAPTGRPNWSELVRALDFPRDAEDRDGFRALEAALAHHSLAPMLQAAEDVLNLLAQEAVYMDDLAVAPVDAEAWRRFIAGARGAAVKGVGGIRDPRALETARRLSKTDSIFRDTALFFLRRFDVVLSEFADGAPDGRIEELADTRCGRAFMLLARTSGAVG